MHQAKLAKQRKLARAVPRHCPYCSVVLPDSKQWKICGSAECKRARGAEQARTRRAKWTETERLAARATEKRWREANPERVRRNNRQAYLRDPARYAELRDAWRAKNPDRHLQIMSLMQSRRRVAKRSGDSRVVTVAEWQKMLRRARGRCFYCAEKAPLTQEHVIPLVRGGRHAIGNIVPACEYCNKSKGRLLVSEWRMRALEA